MLLNITMNYSIITNKINIMKKLVIILIAIMVLMTSCYTQKFYVVGDPGTVIASLNGYYTLATIDQSGEAEIKIKDRKIGYMAFLQAKSPNSDVFVPFALDYKDRNRSTPNSIIGSLTMPILIGAGFLGFTGSCFDYDYLKYQHTNNDLIR